MTMKIVRLWLTILFLVFQVACSLPTVPPTQVLSTPTPTPTPTPTQPEITPSSAYSQIRFEFEQISAGDGAVAVHSLEFIDAKASIIQTILFGTSEANALQGIGWSENQIHPSEGEFQWVNEEQNTAILNVDIPPNTEGILLRAATSRGNIWVHVTLDGVRLGSLRVTGEWRTGYLPVGEAQPFEVSNQLPEWQEGHYFPKFPTQTGRIYAIRVRSQLGNWHPTASSASWRINQSYDAMMALTLVGMQGLINRSNPSVYLDWEQSDVSHQDAHYYLEEIKEFADVVELDLDALSAINFLYRRYASLFQGTVIYDPEVLNTINLATMYAGLENRMILAPEQLGLSGIPELGSMLDLRPLAEENGWNNTVEGEARLYQWVYDNLWPRLEHRAIGIYSPGPPCSRLVPGADNYLPLSMAARDYAVALNLPVLWLSTSEEPQTSLFNRFLDEAPSPIPVFGFFNSEEGGTTQLVSEHGDFVAVITNGNDPLGSPNLSLQTALPIQPAYYQAEIDPDRILQTLTATHVVTLFTSDGDAINYLMGRGWTMLWDQVQGYHYGWSINPILSELAPLVWNDYVNNRSEVGLLAGNSGAGDIRPFELDDAELQAYLEMTGRYMDRTGLRTVLVVTDDIIWDEYYAGLYYNTLHDHGLLGMIVGGGKRKQWGLTFRYSGAPTPGVYFVYEPVSIADTWIIDDLLSKQAGDIFINMAHYGGAEGSLVSDPEAASGEAVVFTTSQPIGWIQGPHNELPPGEYTVTFRLKMEDTTSTLPIARIYVAETIDRHGPDIVSREIFPRDFTVPGQYQDFTLTFAIDYWASRVELGMIPYNGANWDDSQYASALLWADSVHLTRQGGLDFPLFSVMALSMTAPVQPDILQFIEKMEVAGILVLTPDEFMAALNPEYMIEFATPILGADDPSLIQAQALLEDGLYFESLLTVREALKRMPIP